MNQIKKRLEIIKIAIFMSDDETIRLQLLKLEYFQENEQLDKIVDLLKHKSYGQAQVLITEYLDDSKTANTKDIEEENDDFSNSESKSIVDEFGMLKSSSLSSKHGLQSTNLNIQQGKTKDNITSYVAGCKDYELSSDEIEKIPSKKQIPHNTHPKEKVDFSDIFTTTKNSKADAPKEKIVKEEKSQIEPAEDEHTEIQEPTEILETTKATEIPEITEATEITEPELTEIQEPVEATEIDTEDKESENENLEDVLEILINADSETIDANLNINNEEDLENKETNSPYDKKYPPVSDIFHKFQNIALFYVSDKNYTLHKSSANWMHRISKVGYKEIEILKISKYIQKLKEEKEYNEAIQLALICCATESNLGKLIFARELYKGDMVEQDHIKACEMTKELALLDYPEALCDLGQYCEHGIGTKKNLEYALHFYKKSYDLGLERANILYKNLKKNKGLFSFLFKSEL